MYHQIKICQCFRKLSLGQNSPNLWLLIFPDNYTVSISVCVCVCVCVSVAGDELIKMEDSYNQAQRKWVDDMINACRDYQRHEEERSDFLQGHFLQYIETCVTVDEASAEVSECNALERGSL